MLTPQHTINTVYVSCNGGARVESQLDIQTNRIYYAVQLYDHTTRTYIHYKTFDNKHVAIAQAEDMSNA